MKIRFHINRVTGLPHIYDHDVEEEEVEQILRRPIGKPLKAYRRRRRTRWRAPESLLVGRSIKVVI